MFLFYVRLECSRRIRSSDNHQCEVGFGELKEMTKAEAKRLINCALLAACSLHSCYEIANGLEDLARDHLTIYRMLIKLHGEKGAWSRVIEMRNKMMETGAKKLKEVCETNAEYDENITMQQQPPQINSKELNFGPLTFVTAQKARNLWKQKVKPGFRTGRSWLILTAINITIQVHC
ncbi:hypothetical protein Tco_1460083 [Tanacetum coccineum]